MNSSVGDLRAHTQLAGVLQRLVVCKMLSRSQVSSTPSTPSKTVAEFSCCQRASFPICLQHVGILACVWTGEHQYSLHCLKIVQLACDLMRFIFRGGVLAKSCLLKSRPKWCYRHQSEEKSGNKLVISPNSFCFACFVCFFKDQVQIALYAFLH